MRIAHISDIHMARPPALNDLNPKRLLGYINYRLFRSRLYAESVAREALAKMLESPPDLVVLTGDITQHGLDAEFAAARALLNPVIEREIPVIAVPGNHDIYGREESPALTALLRDLRHPLVPDARGILRQGTVEILPLCQCIPTPLFCSYGRQNPQELAKAHEVWSHPPGKGITRIVLGHYPLIDPHGGKLIRYRGLRDSESLIRFCAGHQVSAYFCGHNHKRFAAPLPGGTVQYAAPALSSIRHADREQISVYECGDGTGVLAL